MEIKNVRDTAFQAYGTILSGYDGKEILEVMQDTPLPDDVIYQPSIEKLECLKTVNELKQRFFGQMPIQAGYCNGHNTRLNAVEYHRSSEVNIAVTDMILLLGKQQDIENLSYDTSKMEAFLVEKGTMIELYATTLHYAPCQVKDGFRCVVILPKGTNTELEPYEVTTKEDQLLFAKNKWLMAHKDAQIPQAYVGLMGKNLEIGGVRNEEYTRN